MKVLSRDVSNFFANTEVWTVAPAGLAQHFRLIVTAPHYPTEIQPTCGLIAVDGDLYAGTVASGVNAMMLAGRSREEVPPTVTVSIAYPLGATRDWLSLRNRDLTPTRSLRHEGGLPTLVGVGQCPPTGGADAFLEFIEEEVKPAIQDAHGVNREEWTLSGNSLGGLFSLHAMISKPGCFRRHLSISPSAWWERPLMFDRAREFAVRKEPLSSALFVTVGALETPALRLESLAREPEDVRKSLIESIGVNDMVADAQEIAAILGGRAGLKVRAQVMENESHTSIYGVALSQGLRWLHKVTARTLMR